jgi:predicted ATP-binding protein involved in virulence
MTDLEILKELEKEIDSSLEDCYNTNTEGYVDDLSIRCELKKIPVTLLKLKYLAHLELIDAGIEDFSPLLRLKQLSNLSIEYVNGFIASPIKKYVKETLSLKTLTIYFTSPQQDSFTLFFHLETGHFIREHLEFNDTTHFHFPLISMLSLGYDDIDFYFDYFFSNPHANIFKERIPSEDEISQKLLEIFYDDYQKKELPYAIRRLSIYTFNGIKNILLNDISTKNNIKEISDPQWVFITGENGYGKTSILQAIVIALFGKQDGKEVLTKVNDIDIFLELKNNDKHQIHYIREWEYPNDYGQGGRRYNQKNIPQFTNFAAYGAARLNISNDEKSQTYSLFNSDGTLFNIENSLKLWNNDIDNHKLYENIRHILLELLSPYINDLKVNKKNGEYTLVYHETATSFDDWKTFEELASGYKNIIATFGDMILRLRRQQPKVRNAKDLTGIVLIDEFDLHLHPKWQKELVEKLTKTFPKIQFIVSTHSPIPLLGAPKNSVIINVQRSEEEGITAQKLDIDFTKLTPNSILSSPIFGFEDIFSNETSADEVETADRYETIKGDESLKETLNILKETDEDFFNDLMDDE